MSFLDRLRQFTKKPTAIVAEILVSSAAKKGASPQVAKKSSAPLTKPAEKPLEKKAEQYDEQNGKIATALRSGILRRPIITEKATLTGTYIFEVDTSATKNDVHQAIFATYGVMPHNVRMMNVQGKSVQWSGRLGRRVSWKKAIVRLPKGKTISVYEGT